MVFDDTVSFTVDGPKELSVSATIPDDIIAFEDDELVNVHLTIIDSDASGVNLGSINTTTVAIVDDDHSKFSRI